MDVTDPRSITVEIFSNAQREKNQVLLRMKPVHIYSVLFVQIMNISKGIHTVCIEQYLPNAQEE
jgi:hypothetical protein